MTQGKRRFNRKKMLVSIESYNPQTEAIGHIAVYELERDDLKKLKRVCKMMFDGVDFKITKYRKSDA